ncbi:hypothetical protein FISHEDRAFT_13749, partial [Fistulina hepatica ATCC 64428]
QLDPFDAIFGDGSDLANVKLPQDSAVDELECLRAFDTALDSLQYDSCTICHEAGFQMNFQRGECSCCRRDTEEIKLWSDGNNVNPKLDIPPELTGLTAIEEMLIARSKCVIQVRWAHG